MTEPNHGVERFRMGHRELGAVEVVRYSDYEKLLAYHREVRDALLERVERGQKAEAERDNWRDKCAELVVEMVNIGGVLEEIATGRITGGSDTETLNYVRRLANDALHPPKEEEENAQS